jgi:pyruvate,orthophosphate dikinase
MDGRPVPIRTIDPPFTNFYHRTKPSKGNCKTIKYITTKSKSVFAALHEFNPMLGFRGCRLGIFYPEITEIAVPRYF